MLTAPATNNVQGAECRVQGAECITTTGYQLDVDNHVAVRLTERYTLL
jgi:hypothetical protein